MRNGEAGSSLFVGKFAFNSIDNQALHNLYAACGSMIPLT
jgi:hypothetical protein